MADGQGQQFNTNDYYLKQQAARMLSAIQKGYNDSFSSQSSVPIGQTSNQDSVGAVYINSPMQQQQMQQQQQQQQQSLHQQSQSPGASQHVPQQQLQHQLQQQAQFQQMQQIAQMQQQFHQFSGGNSASGVNMVMSPQGFSPSRRGRKPTDKKKRKRHTWVKRPTTAYLYFVSKYRETLKEAGEVVPKAKIITQACAEKWRNMTENEKEPFLELSRRDRERWQKDKALEKKPRDPNRPKRPPSAYFLFLAEFRKEYPGKTDPAKEITKKAGEAWNNLSEQEKTPFYRDAQVVRAKWEKDLEAYKQTTSGTVDKNGPLSRSSSLQSDTGQLEDASPASGSPQDELADIDMIQNAGVGMMGIPSAPVLEEDSSISGAASSSAVSYPYPHHIPGGQSSSMQQFSGR